MTPRRLILLALVASAAVSAAEPAAPAAAPKPLPAVAKPAAAAVAAKPAAGAACRSSSNTLPSGLVSFRDCEGAPEMLGLRGGKYKMGDQVGDGQPYERPVHEVQLAPFALGRFEITNAEYKACVTAGSCTDRRAAVDEQHGRYPVVSVTWNQARIYTEWLAARTGKPYRLPSEAEWEYAARAGLDGRYPWGSFDPNPCAHANILDASGRRLHPEWTWGESCDDGFPEAAPVGSFKGNDWGYADLLGNVWEWVADCWHSDFTGAPTDGSAWLGESCRKRVNRGGGFGNNVRSSRLSSRDGDPSDSSSDGLGFRVARSLSLAELPGNGEGAPDARAAAAAAAAAAAPPPGLSRKLPVGTMIAPPAAPRAAAAAAAPVLASLATERQLDVHLTVKGEQTWKNGLQHTEGTTQQDYVLSTRLRSDGVLYGDNLLDLDPEARLSIKRRFLARRGLIAIKAQNGGKLPRTAEELAAMMGKVQDTPEACRKDMDCSNAASERYAAIEALQQNTIEDLEALIAAPATGDAARWLYFFGYPSCPTTIRISQQTHTAGERAYDRDKKKLVPWSLDRKAESTTDATMARDGRVMCQRDVATVDIRTGTVYLENLYVPSPRGTTVRTRSGIAEKVEEEMPIPAELLSWSSQLLRQTKETLETSQSVPAYAPFDGDYTVLGHFDGKLDLGMSWSFKPVPGAPLAVIPPPTGAK